MILNKLSRAEAEKLAAERGLEVESDQNGIKRIVIDGIVVEGGRYGGNLEMSVAAVPKKARKYRLTTTVKAKGGDVEVVVGDFDYASEPANYAYEIGLPENNYKIAEADVEVSE